jgi:hypothetical protein
LHDYDITASRPTEAEAKANHDLFFCSIGVELAYIQGNIYQQLYSGRAQSENGEIKAQRARVLADQMITLRQQLRVVGTADEYRRAWSLTFLV